jgi:signal transduction histidine kinase
MRIARLVDLLPRPLDPVRSIKLKLGMLLVAAGFAGLSVFWIGIGWIPYATSFTAIVVALATSQVLAHGMTSPLREMTAAARAMAKGDYSRRVRATSRDEVGQLAAAFNSMAEDLALADKQRRELIANVSHELRTPITALQAVLENIVDGVAEPDPETFATMLAQVERLGRLVQQLLDLSRLESGTLALDRRHFEIEPMLDLALRESRLHSDAVSLEIEIEPREFSLEADAERLHQVVANLVENAVRHSPRDGRVIVRAIATADGARLEVIDEGPGIPDADASRVFERFYRADSARSSRDGGAGLGLAIARWIVELHGGDIRAERSEPHGCRMVVRIPGRIELHEPAAPSATAVSTRKPVDESLSISERG